MAAQVWPRDAVSEPYFAYLRDRYDVPQREAIVASASHLASEEEQAASRVPVPPITLVQGPPGTGKTHTVKGILNSWHTIMYHRHHTAWLQQAKNVLRAAVAAASGAGPAAIAAQLMAALAGAGEEGGLDEGGGGGGGLLAGLRAAAGAAPKPRILVCAPSNAATDELLDRILGEGAHA